MQFLCVFTVSFLLLQASSDAHPYQENLETSGKEIVDNVLNVILEGVDYLINYIQEFDDKYARDPSQVNKEEVEELVERGNQIFNLTIQVINKLFDNVEQNTGKEVKKAMECIRAEEDNAKRALDHILTDYAQCIDVHIPEIMTSYQDALKAVIKARNTLASAQAKLNKCMLADLCLVQLLTDLKDLPKNLKDLLKAAPPIVKVLEEVFFKDTPKCIKDDAIDIAATVAKLVGDVSSCILH